MFATAAEVGLALCDLCNGEIPDSVTIGILRNNITKIRALDADPPREPHRIHL